MVVQANLFGPVQSSDTYIIFVRLSLSLSLYIYIYVPNIS